MKKILLTLLPVVCLIFIAAAKPDPDFLLYNKDLRLAAVARLKRIVIANYGLLPIKEERLRLKTEEIFRNAANTEEQTADPVESNENALANMRFLDRMLQLGATFQDSHLKVRPVARRPQVIVGLTIRPVGKRFYIVQTYPKLLGDNAINIGDEVMALDGEAIDVHLNRLMQYIPASSDAARLQRAVSALTRRDYLYPDKAQATWTIVSPKTGKSTTVALPFWYQSKANQTRKDASQYLSQLGIKPIAKGGAESASILQNDVPSGMIDVRSYSGGHEIPGEPVLRIGYFSLDGQKVGVIRILTFEDDAVVLDNKNKPHAKPVPVYGPVVSFLKHLKATHTPLILDLRGNGGGIGQLPGKLLSHLARNGDRFSNVTESFLLTPFNRQLIEQDDNGQHPEKQALIDALRAAVLSQSLITKPVSSGPDITASPDVGGFSEKIAAIIDPGCGSACDRMALLLKSSHRALLVGTQSHGMGGGFKTGSPFDITNWRDDAQIISIDVPNVAWGIDKEVSVENQPVQADVYHAPTLNDWLDGGVDYYAAALKALTIQSHRPL